jgi:SlyX protein
MADPENHDTRIEALETRIAYQECTIEDLNAAVTEQWKRIETLTRELTRLTDRVQLVEDNAAPDGPEAPPPHY